MSNLPMLESPAEPPTAALPVGKRRISWRLIVPAVLLALIVTAAVFAPLIAPYAPNAQNLSARLLPPFWQSGGTVAHLLGTDDLGRDILTRILYGAQVSLSVGAIAVVCRLVVGVLIGLVAGYYAGPIRTFFMRLGDVQLALPSLVLAIGIIAALGPSLANVILVLAIAGWVLYARLVVSEVMVVRQQEYVASARLLGASHLRIMLRHVLPNIMPTVIVFASLDFGMMMLTEGSLSFLGLGVQPPQPSWGGMAAEGRALIGTAWWIATLPGAALVITVALVNILGEQLRDRLDPRLDTTRTH
ncbi:ABC transporter permease [Agromyces aerolatus]|uniref:ABC transporter permease n=1 Tax=Agromyces sp. LY-1074 TaxID=3074080 RepID=UPI002864CCDC|nr:MULTISPECIES: ABC transporter permease [unclassified Agromyces]MDR5701855.1 ABC transporter permease [Agromyces sp. LY-1074]MDR5708072.1 ABC transporter permease [Agromyces sp. LY-1358]